MVLFAYYYSYRSHRCGASNWGLLAVSCCRGQRLTALDGLVMSTKGLTGVFLIVPAFMINMLNPVVGQQFLVYTHHVQNTCRGQFFLQCNFSTGHFLLLN